MAKTEKIEIRVTPEEKLVYREIAEQYRLPVSGLLLHATACLLLENVFDDLTVEQCKCLSSIIKEG